MADIREQSPVSTKASAGVKNAGEGMRLALAFIKDAEVQASEEAKKGETMKAKLSKLMKLTTEEHNAFCAHMNEKREEIKQKAKDAGYDTLQKYFESGTKDGSVAASMQATVSLWVKMSLACALGWKPDTKKPWAVLSKEATSYKKPADVKKDEPESNAEKLLRQAKEQQEAVNKVAKAAQAALTSGEGDKAELTETARSALPDVVASVVKWASPEELDLCIAKLQQMKQAIIAAREAAAKATAKASKSSHEEPESDKPGQSGTGQPAKAEAKIAGEHVRTRSIVRKPVKQ